METPTTPTQKLDAILYALSGTPFKNLGTIQAYLNDNFSFKPSIEEILRIVRHLEEEKYVRIDNQDTVRLTFRGELFNESGRYKAKVSRDADEALSIQAETKRKLKLDRNLEANSTRLNNLTRYLAWGTIALAVIEIVKFLCDLDPCIKIFFERVF